MKIKKIMEFILFFLSCLKLMAITITMFYIWMAASHYLLFNVNAISAKACFYGGLFVIVLYLLTSPIVKEWVKGLK